MIISNVEQKTYEWFVLKLAKVSGSIAKKVHGAEWRKLIYKLIEEDVCGYIEEESYESADMAWGNQHEPIIAQIRQDILGIELKQCGFMQNEIYQWIGYSPDRYYEDENGYVIEEYKCPTTAKHIEVLATNKIPSSRDYWEAQCFHAFQLDAKVHTVNFTCYDPRFEAKPHITISLHRNDHEVRINKEHIQLLEFRKVWQEVSQLVTF